MFGRESTAVNPRYAALGVLNRLMKKSLKDVGDQPAAVRDAIRRNAAAGT